MDQLTNYNCNLQVPKVLLNRPKLSCPSLFLLSLSLSLSEPQRPQKFLFGRRDYEKTHWPKFEAKLSFSSLVGPYRPSALVRIVSKVFE